MFSLKNYWYTRRFSCHQVKMGAIVADKSKSRKALSVRTLTPLEIPKFEYINSLYQNKIPSIILGALKLAREKSDQFNKTGISLNDHEGHLLYSFVKLFQCKKFVEIGTLTGASGLWIAAAMNTNFATQNKHAKFWSIEKDPAHHQAAQEVFKEVQNQDLKNCEINLLLGDARQELINLESQGPYDGVFIDGNKAAYGDYLDWAEKNLSPGALLVADNVYLSGAVWNGKTPDTPFSEKQIKVMRLFNEKILNGPQWESLLVPTDEGLIIAKWNPQN